MAPCRSAACTVSVLVTVALAGCEAGLRSPEGKGAQIVYGADDRQEYYEILDPLARGRVGLSTVALIPNRWLDVAAGAISSTAPSWGVVGQLCPGERFAEQPAIAFCTGVLVDSDLVLTAGHCLRVYALRDFSVVFGYYYAAPGELAVAADDIFEPLEILSEALPEQEGETRLDYGWLRLSRPVPPSKEPVPVYTQPPPLAPGDALVAIGAGSGLPLKLDAASSVRDVRDFVDYFITNTDDGGGWSGGGAFDGSLALLGILARGGPDLVETDQGCRRSSRMPETDEGQEQFTYVHQAVQALCARHPEASSICRPGCEQPCRASPFDPKQHAREAGGCATTGHAPLQSDGAGAWVIWLLLIGLLVRRRPS